MVRGRRRRGGRWGGGISRIRFNGVEKVHAAFRDLNVKHRRVAFIKTNVNRTLKQTEVKADRRMPDVICRGKFPRRPALNHRSLQWS